MNTDHQPAPATLVAISQEAAATYLCRVRPDRPLSYRPGQVAALQAVGGTDPAGIFAIASAPHRDERDVLFLIKAAPGAADNLLALQPGAPLTIAGPLGAGFEIADLPGRDVLLVGAGSAIAPLRSLLEALLTDRKRYGALSLIHGVRSPKDAAFAGDHPRWRAGGVQVRVVVSRLPVPVDPLVRAGHVQDHLADLVTMDTVAFIAGMSAMETATRAQLRALGLRQDRIRVNTDR